MASNGQVPAALPSTTYQYSGFLQRTFTVAAGFQTLYLNGYVFGTGADASDLHLWSNGIAVFYPN